MSERTCVQCDAVIPPGARSDRKYCSPLCSARALNDRRRADGRLREQREKYADQRKAWQRKAYAEKRYHEDRTCELCDESFTCHRDSGTRFCSTTCSSIGKRPSRYKRSTLARFALAKAARGTSGGGRRFISGRCFQCGSDCTSTTFDGAPSPSLYCSDSCYRSAKKERHRARRSGAEITPGRRYAIYERDSWTCRICGDPVNREAKVPDLDAPVIDHRIPLNVGGEHAESNWQTAHFYCNSVKQDRAGFDFAAA